MSNCPLCSGSNLNHFHQDKHREYVRCSACQLVIVPPQFYLTAEQEKAFYDLHENNIYDQGYRKFLSRTLSPVLQRVSQDANGLDFGCGPGPALFEMAVEAGYSMEKYDLYYFPDKTVLNKQYDFITITEVIEHVADAKSLLEQLDGMLKPAGVLAIMTKRVISHEAFINWHYKSDLTHINFYSEETFNWIAQQYNWTLDVVANDVVIFTKKG